MRAFTERPYDAVSTDEIAAKAGISRGLIFHYFPTKHDYYVAVLRVAADQLVRETVSQEGTLSERLESGLRTYFRFVDEHARAYATLLRAGMGGDAVVHEIVEATRGRFIATIRAELASLAATTPPDARLVRVAVRGWIGLLEAIALDWIDHRDLGHDALVALATRAIGLVVAVAGDLRLKRRRRSARGRA